MGKVEYTIMSGVALVLSFLLALASRTNMRMLLAAGLVSLAFQLVFDNLMTYVGLWKFSERYILGIRVPFIPAENLAFGLSLMVCTVLCWELLAKVK
ncbi:MAG: lycopene cyclase domain-containing protein [Candidatus Micrarchaeota archaeon]|nr:lycopene cyclase domain-containing protein [Candidatus Micrarchaeota archaeon]